MKKIRETIVNIVIILMAMMLGMCVVYETIRIYILCNEQYTQELTIGSTDQEILCKLEGIEDELTTIKSAIENLSVTQMTETVHIKEDSASLAEEEEIAEVICPDKNIVPEMPTNWFTGEPMDMITNTKSDQYLLQQLCQTEAETGARYYIYNGIRYYTVALAANYGRTIGDSWFVELDTGHSFYIMLGDYKDDGSDITRLGDATYNYEGECLNVIEFIIERDAVPDHIWQYGSLTRLDKFDGNIITMRHLGAIDWQGEVNAK